MSRVIPNYVLTAQFVLGILLFTSTFSHADNWPNWRGPEQNGNATGSEYATTWSPDENVVWKFDLPGLGASTPAIWEDHIFLSLVEGGKNVALCLNRKGEEVWKKSLGAAADPKHKKATGANSSPVTDGEHVVFYFKSGDLICLTVAGDVVWEKNTSEFGENTLWWDMGTSPVLARGQVIVTHQQTGPSWIAAFDKSTGDLAWKVDRKVPAPKEAAQSYTTPIVVGEGDSQQLVLAGADHVTAHNLNDGAELWRVGGLNPGQHEFFRSIASPVANKTHVLVPYARGDSLTAVRLGGSGDVTNSHVDWVRDFSCDVPTPAIIRDRVYVLRDKKGIACLNTASGETVWEDKIEKNRTAFSSSPIVADGKVYLTREDGTTFVIRDGDAFELLAKNELGEMTVATPVLVDGKIYIRTAKSLYCIAE